MIEVNNDKNIPAGKLPVYGYFLQNGTKTIHTIE
jgi:hypothetical protein